MITGVRTLSNSHTVQALPALDAQTAQPDSLFSRLILKSGETTTRLLLRALNKLDQAESEKLNAALNNVLQKAATNFTPAELTQSINFILHGLVATTASGMAAKVEDNLRILLESKNMQSSVLMDTPVPQAPSGFRFELRPGKNEELCGLHLKLYRQDSEELAPCLAKLGFFFDATDSTFVIQTIHGLRPIRVRPNQEFAAELKSEKRDREKIWFRAASELQNDPRVVLLQALETLAQEHYLKAIKAIRPSEHPYTIAQHQGFTGKYEKVLTSAHFLEHDSVYMQKKLR